MPLEHRHSRLFLYHTFVVGAKGKYENLTTLCGEEGDQEHNVVVLREQCIITPI